MATTMFFEEKIKDPSGSENEVTLEIGRTSYGEEDSIYISINGEWTILNGQTGREFVDAVSRLGAYLGYSK